MPKVKPVEKMSDEEKEVELEQWDTAVDQFISDSFSEIDPAPNVGEEKEVVTDINNYVNGERK